MAAKPGTEPGTTDQVDSVRQLLAGDAAHQRKLAASTEVADLQPGTVGFARADRAYKILDTTAAPTDVQAVRALLASRGWRPLTGPYAAADTSVAEYVAGMPSAELWWMPSKDARVIELADLERARANPIHAAIRKSRLIQRTL